MKTKPKKKTPPPTKVTKGPCIRYFVRAGFGDWAEFYLYEWKNTDSDGMAGSIAINSSYGTFGYTFGGVGNSFKEFLISTNMDYMMDKLSSYKLQAFSFEKTVQGLKDDVREMRKSAELDREQARHQFNYLKELEYTDNGQYLIEKFYSDGVLTSSDLWERGRTEVREDLKHFWEKLWLPLMEEFKTDLIADPILTKRKS